MPALKSAEDKNYAWRGDKKFSEFLLASAKSSKIIAVDDLPKLVVEIIRIGTNINQIARIANTKKSVGKANFQAIENDMSKIQQQLNAIIKKINAPQNE